MLRPTLLPLTLVLCGAGPVRSRVPQLQVTSVQDLAFGNVFPGVVITVQPTDARAGQYTITNSTGKQIQAQLTFTLPAALTSGAGATAPLSFQPTSAGFSPTGSLANVVLFDPNVPFTVTIAGRSSGRVFLGGTLQPGSSQSAGGYSATITLLAN